MYSLYAYVDSIYIIKIKKEIIQIKKKKKEKEIKKRKKKMKILIEK